MASILIGVIVIVAVIVIIVALTQTTPKTPHRPILKEYELVGRQGEEYAEHIVKTVLRDGDRLLTNVNISFEDRPAELDMVVVNSCGVFIIEVKNYNGFIVGTEDDFEWQKYKTTGAGNVYEKDVRNPIKQVKRQIYILAHYLDYYGVKVWVEGFAILLMNNSPVGSDYILESPEEANRAIHTPGRNRLSAKTVEKVVTLLKDN